MTEKQTENSLQYELNINRALASLYEPLANSSIQEVSEKVLEHAKQLTGSIHGFASVIDPKSHDMIAYTLTEMMTDKCTVSEENKKFIFSRGSDGTYPALWGYSLNTHEEFYTNTPYLHPSSSGIPDGHVHLEKFLSMPVLSGDNVIGLIALANPGKNYNDTDLDTVRMLAKFYALAIQRTKIESSLHENEERFRLIFENAPDAMFLAYADTGIILNANKAAEKLLLKSHDEIIGLQQSELHPPKLNEISQETFKQHLDENLNKKQISYIESKVLRSDGTEIPVEILAHMITIDGKPVLQGIFRDITERKHAEGEIQKSLAEKELLMRELQHRVKNNLNVLHSLIHLESRKLTDENSKEIFKNAENRIRSMAIIYEKLYQSKNISEIRLDNYIIDLSNQILKTYNISSGKIHFEYELSEIVIDFRRAVSIGLLINEIITNSLKYAFPENISGIITIKLDKIDNNIILTISDNGTGLPKDFDIEKLSSMGLNLVKLMAEQLEAEINLLSENGTKLIINMPLL